MVRAEQRSSCHVYPEQVALTETAFPVRQGKAQGPQGHSPGAQAQQSGFGAASQGPGGHSGEMQDTFPACTDMEETERRQGWDGGPRSCPQHKPATCAMPACQEVPREAMLHGSSLGLLPAGSSTSGACPLSLEMPQPESGKGSGAWPLHREPWPEGLLQAG